MRSYNSPGAGKPASTTLASDVFHLPGPQTIGILAKGKGEISILDLEKLYNIGVDLGKNQREIFNSTFDGVEG